MKYNLFYPATLLVLVSIFVTGCMPIWSGRDLQDEVADLEARQIELEEEARDREVTLAKMIDEARAEIDELEDVMEEARKILARDSADIGAEVSQTREDINRVRGSLEELEFLHRRLDQSFQLFRDDMDTRFDGIEPDELLERAEGFMEDGEVGLARRALEHFLSEYEEHELATEARLDLAEVYFQTENWESAGGEFDKVRLDSSSTARQARATRRIGEVFMQMGNCDNAKIFFESVIADFPNSEEVADARVLLGKVERGECP